MAFADAEYYSSRISDLNESIQKGEKHIANLRGDARLSLSIGNKERHDYLLLNRIPTEQVLIHALKKCVSDFLLESRQKNRTLKANHLLIKGEKKGATPGDDLLSSF